LRAACLFAAGALAILAAAACGGTDSDDDGLVLTPVTAAYLPVVVSSDLAIGPSRFTLGLIDQSDSSQVTGADLHMRFFTLDGSEATLQFEAQPDAVRITRTYTHTHDDGTVETHEAGETGVYVAQVDFPAAGNWAVEVSGTVEGREIEPVRPTFTVLEKSATPGIGEPAPRSVQPILSDVSDISEIDTTEVPIPEMHDKTIAEAVTSGRPTVIAFATPAFCVSQVCGPTKEIVDDVYGTYGDRANFVHVEPYDIERARDGEGLFLQPFIADEWHLPGEPWVFVVDAQGNIAAKFEGIMSREELLAALGPLLP
jgi:hypothetical protein